METNERIEQVFRDLLILGPNLMNLNRIAGSNGTLALILKPWLKFKVEPTMLEPRRMFEPLWTWFKFLKFGFSYLTDLSNNKAKKSVHF